MDEPSWEPATPIRVLTEYGWRRIKQVLRAQAALVVEVDGEERVVIPGRYRDDPWRAIEG